MLKRLLILLLISCFAASSTVVAQEGTRDTKRQKQHDGIADARRHRPTEFPRSLPGISETGNSGARGGVKGVVDESFEAWPPSGWTLDPGSGDGSWAQDDGSTYGPGASNIYDGFYAAMFSNYDYADGVTGSLITPQFDVSTYVNPQVSFYWWNNDGSNSPAKLTVSTSPDGTTYTDIETIDTYGSGTTTWVYYNHDISTSDQYIKITAISDWGTKNTFIDKFEVYEGPIGPIFSIDPDTKDYGTVNVGETSTQTFSITNTGGSTLTISSAPTITGSNPLDFSITDSNSYPRDLVPNEIMTLDVTFSPQEEGPLSANLHIEDNSKGSHDVPLSGTGHDPTLTPPFTEDFSSYPPADWTEGIGMLADPSSISGTTSSWTQEDYRNDSGASNGMAARIEIQYDSINDWLFSPPIDLGDGTIHYQLDLDLALTDWFDSSDPANPPEADDKFAIIISTDNGGSWSSANALQIWDSSSNPALSDIPSEGQHLIFDLSPYTGTVKIGFYGETTVTGSDFDVFVDNFYIREKPTTPVFSINPGNKDFGFQAVNTTSDPQTFTVTNTGGGTMQISSVSLNGNDTSEFILTDNNTYPVNLAANESMSVDVVFAPVTNVGKSASLDFIADTKATHSVPLSGHGKNINHDGDGVIFGGYYFANSTSEGGPYRPSYEWIDPVAEGHTEITNWTNDGTSGGDDSYFDATIPFSFSFFGNDYTHAYINSNGAIEFSQPAFALTGADASIPSSDAPNNFIAGCMMDLDARSLGKVYYGSDDDGNFVVTWRHYHDFDDDTEYITFQIILKQNGNIKIQYNFSQSSLATGCSSDTIYGDALIGIENLDGSDGLQYRNNCVDGPIFDPAKTGDMALEISEDPSTLAVELQSFSVNDGE